MAALHDKTGLHVTTLPKQTEAGNPDFRVWDGRARITGYIEAKKPGANLDQVETSDQLKRYLHTFPNVILTDFYEFRLYRDGQRLARVVAGQSFVPGTLKAPSPVRDAEGLADLFGKFFSFSLPRRFTARTLAVELAKRTRFLRDEVVALELREQEKQGKGDILGFYRAFKDYLIADLSLEQFADLYAQTVTYGMFAARTRTKSGFDRRSAFDRIPRTIGLLRDLFRYISYGEIPEPLARQASVRGHRLEGPRNGHGRRDRIARRDGIRCGQSTAHGKGPAPFGGLADRDRDCRPAGED